MAEGKNNQLFRDSWFKYENQMKNHNEKYSSSSSSSIGEESTVSNGSSSISSSDMAEDASSSASASPSSSSSANSSRALYDLSEIMEQLPIKRGLSKFYEGKSESFTSLSRVGSIEDLAKKSTPLYRRRNLKGCKSIGTGLYNCYKPYTLLPKAIITKRTTTMCSSSFSSRGAFKNSNPD